MPRKTKSQSKEDPEDTIMNPIDDEPMPKRKSVRKAATARLSRSAGMGDIATPDSDESTLSGTVGSVSAVENISIASRAVHAANIHGRSAPEPFTRPQSIFEPATFVEQPVHAAQPTTQPIVPTIETAYIEPTAGPDEKQFLAPDYDSFNLDQKPKRSGIATFFIWLLDIIIIVGIIALFLLYKYPTQTQNAIGKVIPKFALQQVGPTSPSSSSASQTPGAQLTFRTATSVTALASIVDTNVQSQFSTFTVQSSTDPSEVSSQKLNSDTILYTSSSQSEAQQIATYLTKQFGIQPQMQEAGSLQEDVLLYLAATIANPNLSNDVAAVYNASGVSGAAKQYCTDLTNDKAASCSAANAITTSTGLQVSYKTEAQHFTLVRTSIFAGATFQIAPASQAQDIVVTVGK
jgi:hypothetical protein